jgi:hypothetical protein
MANVEQLAGVAHMNAHRVFVQAIALFGIVGIASGCKDYYSNNPEGYSDYYGKRADTLDANNRDSSAYRDAQYQADDGALDDARSRRR